MGNQLPVVFGVAVARFGALDPAGVELQIVFLGEADPTVDLVSLRGHAPAGFVDPGLRLRDFQIGGSPSLTFQAAW